MQHKTRWWWWWWWRRMLKTKKESRRQRETLFCLLLFFLTFVLPLVMVNGNSGWEAFVQKADNIALSSLAGGGGSIPGNLDLKTLEYETEEKRRLVRRRFFLVFVFFFSFLYPLLLLLLLLLSFWVVHIKNKIRGFFGFFFSCQFCLLFPAKDVFLFLRGEWNWRFSVTKKGLKQKRKRGFGREGRKIQEEKKRGEEKRNKEKKGEKTQGFLFSWGWRERTKKEKRKARKRSSSFFSAILMKHKCDDDQKTDQTTKKRHQHPSSLLLFGLNITLSKRGHGKPPQTFKFCCMDETFFWVKSKKHV